MEANGSEKAFCVLTFHERRSVTIVQRQLRTYRAPVRYVTKTWSVVLLNENKHILLSQVYCVWQVVKTPTIILNNPVFLLVYLVIVWPHFTKAREMFCVCTCLVFRSSECYIRTLSLISYKELYKCMYCRQNVMYLCVLRKVTKHEISEKLSGGSRPDMCAVTNMMKPVVGFANQWQRQLR
jgi:hypothetical protein